MVVLRLVVLWLLIFQTKSFCAQSTDNFLKMRTGRFKYANKLEGTTIVRTKKKQVEYSNNGNSKLILRVKWLNDSTYTLTHKKSVNKDPGCLVKGVEILVQIKECDSLAYFATYSSTKCGKGESYFIKIE